MTPQVNQSNPIIDLYDRSRRISKAKSSMRFRHANTIKSDQIEKREPDYGNASCITVMKPRINQDYQNEWLEHTSQLSAEQSRINDDRYPNRIDQSVINQSMNNNNRN